MKKLIINYSLREKRFALLNRAVVEKLVIEQPQQQSAVGNIYLGTVTKVLPGMNAVFVDIGEDKNGFLHRDKLPSFVCSQESIATRKLKSVSSFVFQGEKLLVQVEKDETGDKGPRLTGLIELHGESVIYVPNGNSVSVSKKIADEAERQQWEKLARELKAEKEGFIFRTAIAGQAKETVITQIEQLRMEYHHLVKAAELQKKPGLIRKNNSFFELIKDECGSHQSLEVFVDHLELKQQLEAIEIPNAKITYYQGKENIFSAHHIEHETEQALLRKVKLSNGAYLVIDQTEALTVIDVNTGKFSGKNKLAETVLQTNLLAAVEVVKQLRLRDIGGIILIDFIDMKSEQDRKQLLKTLEKEISVDEKQTKLLGFSALGIVQLTRKRTKQAISEALMVECPVCAGAGRVLSPETMAFRLERELWEHRNTDHDAVWIEATEDVRTVFSGEKDVHLNRLQEMLGIKIFLTVKEWAKPFYEIRQFGTVRDLEARIK
ncbi:Rne/Rng family ribonuclease [Neobacillus sp. LXY-4]|uniref:Rne/Rng family ribonuclease n=1 Tax=Neobacillus sp. LXY-4 TaxID=3379826 RepID=UPI003EE00694